MGLLRTISVGALAGGIATGAMTAFMFGVWRQNPMGQKPPERITEGVLDRVGVPRSEESQDVLASLLHIAFGMGGGATFALIRKHWPLPLPGVLQGILFGSGVWAVSYRGWVPYFHLMPPPERDRPGRPEAMLAAHWVYGGVLAMLLAIAGDEKLKFRLG